MSNSKWNFDPSHSSIGFVVRHMMFSKVRGRFNKWAGDIILDENDLGRSSLNVTIDPASVDTQEEKRDAHLRSADFFDVEHHPTMTFRSKKIVDAGGGDLRVTGDLTIRGVTREVELKAEQTGRGKDPWGGERIGFAAHTSINRKDYGLNWNQLLEAGGVLVAEKVDIELEIELVKAA